MSSEKKGFSGLDDLVSDISEDLTSKPAKPAKSNLAPRSEPTPEPRSVSPSNSPPPFPQGPAQPSHPQSSGGGAWAIGIVVLVVFLVIAFASGGRKEVASSQGQSSAPSAPPPSIYALGIPDISSDQDRLINALLQAGQWGDVTAIENAAAAIEALSIKPTIDKTVFKNSRAKNKVGLQHHKEDHDDLAAKEFFDAYKLNPYDPEVADNLGYVLYGIGDYSAAKKAYLASLIRSARRASAWGGLAKVFALSGAPDKAANAFALAFRLTKAPKTLRQTLLTSYREEKLTVVKSAIGAALAANYSAVVAQFLKPVLGNLAGVEIPVFLPTAFAPLDYEGKPIAAYALHNGAFSIQTTADSYHIPVGSEADCVSMACGIGAISARKALPTDTDEGEPVELQDGIKGVIVKGVYRESDHLVFRIGDVRYSFNLGSAAAADVDAANSALKLRAIPTEILGVLPKMAMAAPPPPEPVTQYPAAPVSTAVPAQIPVPAYFRPPANPYCTTTYDISLNMFGEGVSVELRSGFPGSSTIIDVAQSSGGNVHFSGLCAGSYFIAIGNSESVSVTPVRNFENDMAYRSSIQMQRGAGNVSSKRRGEL